MLSYTLMLLNKGTISTKMT